MKPLLLLADVILPIPPCPEEGTWSWWLRPECWVFSNLVEVLLCGLLIASFMLPLFFSLRQTRDMKAGKA